MAACARPLYGYIILLEKLYFKKIVINSSFNFGPDKKSNKSVNDVINLINEYFNNSVKVKKKKNNFLDYKESKIFMLNSDFFKKNLKWRTKYDLEQTIKLTSLWYKELINEQGKNILKFSQDQIRNYIK